MFVTEQKIKGPKLLLVTLCALVLAITLIAGLWPFSFHVDNEVSWRPERDGLYFGGQSTVVSNGKFMGMSHGGGSSIEIWAEPGSTSESRAFLAFYNPRSPDWIEVRQSDDDLAFTRFGMGTPDWEAEQKSTYVDNVFRKDEKTLITLTASEGVLNVFVNGVLKKSTNSVAFSANDFKGTLVVGDSPYGHANFIGVYRGLALYDRVLCPEEIRQNYETWKQDREQIARIASPYSLYLFNEQEGEILHNVVEAGPDLAIPKRYFVVQRSFLVPFWKEFQPSRDYVKGVAINILGLVPLGSCFAALFARLVARRRTVIYVAILGFCVSLTIEILQAFLPTRYSGTTDLITNTVGSVLGAWLYLNAFTQSQLQRWKKVRVG